MCASIGGNKYNWSTADNDTRLKTRNITTEGFTVYNTTFSLSFDNSFSGTYLVATRDIKPLETIVDQYPLVHGPYAKPPQPQCLECYKILEEVKDKDKNGNETST